jgi:hypothetical protein
MHQEKLLDVLAVTGALLGFYILWWCASAADQLVAATH